MTWKRRIGIGGAVLIGSALAAACSPLNDHFCTALDPVCNTPLSMALQATPIAALPALLDPITDDGPFPLGNVHAPPSCIANDYPSGIAGSGNATFSVVDEQYKYYKDRNYHVVLNADFTALGFAQALMISTCNGNSPCGTLEEHKHYVGDAYVAFTAHTDMDLYLMYDTRGGASPSDPAADAPWINAAGFSMTGAFVQTTDMVGKYKVYKKQYNVGDPIILDGNRKGVTDQGINTNYWVVLKNKGVTDSQPASALCRATPVASETVGD